MSLSWFEAFLDRLLPEPCAHCGARAESPGALYCSACSALCRAAPARFVDGVPAVAAFAFEGPVRDVLHRFKYQAQPELARRLAAALLERSELRAFTRAESVCFVPVPIHRERLLERGYNQAALLAVRLAQRTRAQVRVRTLERLTNTQRQVTLTRPERAANLRDQIVARGALSGRVAVVDDVLTTGATARACFEAIRAAGAEPALIVTLAAAE